MSSQTDEKTTLSLSAEIENNDVDLTLSVEKDFGKLSVELYDDQKISATIEIKF